jgi:3-deoxy-D-manno-octulosonic acid (KDO) 8-phosphate synthase
MSQNILTNQQTESTIITALRQAFEVAIASDIFKDDKKAVQKAIDALEIPDPEARFRKLFLAIANRNLLAKAPKDENGNIRCPSDTAITAEVGRLLTNRRAKKGNA